MDKCEQYEIAATWFETLTQGDLEQLVSLYSDVQLSFHPTLSNEHIKELKNAREYLKRFLAKKPQVRQFQGIFFDLCDRAFLYSGTMQFTYTADDRVDKEELATARFSFVWKKERNNLWRIILHHNSLSPHT